MSLSLQTQVTISRINFLQQILKNAVTQNLLRTVSNVRLAYIPWCQIHNLPHKAATPSHTYTE